MLWPMTMAPRISRRLIEAIVRFDDPGRPIAETYRRVAGEAERLGLTRPSYQRIRQLVHEARAIRSKLTVSDVLHLVTMPLKSTDDGIERLSRLGVRPIGQWGYAPEDRRPP